MSTIENEKTFTNIDLFNLIVKYINEELKEKYNIKAATVLQGKLYIYLNEDLNEFAIDELSYDINQSIILFLSDYFKKNKIQRVVPALITSTGKNSIVLSF